MNFFSFAFSATQINSQVDESIVDVSKGTSPWTSSQVKAAAVMMIKGKTLWSMFRSHDFSVAFLSSKLYFSYATWEKLNFSCLRRKKEKQKRRDGASEIFALEALPHCLDNFFSEISTSYEKTLYVIFFVEMVQLEAEQYFHVLDDFVQRLRLQISIGKNICSLYNLDK